jgi:hypothetical protein
MATKNDTQKGCCAHFNGKTCTLMGLTTKGVRVDEDMKPDRKNGKNVCERQIPNWMSGAVPCGVPQVESRQFKYEFHKMAEITYEAGQVLNQIANENNCEHSNTSSMFGPQCNEADGPCWYPNDHDNCPVYQCRIGDKYQGTKLRDEILKTYCQGPDQTSGRPRFCICHRSRTERAQQVPACASGGCHPG